MFVPRPSVVAPRAFGASAIVLSLFAGSLATLAIAQPPIPAPLAAAAGASGLRAREVPIEHPEALAAFHRALDALAHDPSRRVRVLHYGDSNVAADLWTKVARDTLRARYGDGGGGYLLPRGHGSANRGRVTVREDGPWVSRRRGFARDFGPTDGLWGLAGVGVEPERPGAALEVDVPAADDPSHGARVFEVHLLGRPRPGAVDVSIDGGPPVRIDLELDAPGLILRRFALDSSAHRIRVRHASGLPRVLGIVVERDRGVIYDVLGINGHRASAILHWDEDLLRAQLRERAPDLVIFSYGGNEALDARLPIPTYVDQTRRAVARLHALAPGASCLLVGPLATYPDHADRMRAVSTAQRRIAPELGCAFWDSSQTTGGPGTLERWGRAPGMVSADHLHLGRAGYEAVGRVFVRALLRGASGSLDGRLRGEARAE